MILNGLILKLFSILQYNKVPRNNPERIQNLGANHRQ